MNMTTHNQSAIKIILSLCVLLSLVVGCEPVPHYNDMRTAALAGPFPKRPYGSVQLYQSFADVTRPYQIIGLLSEEGSPGDEALMIQAMLYKAADLGGDAVVLGGPNFDEKEIKNNSVAVKSGIWAAIGNGNNYLYRGQVIRFTSSKSASNITNSIVVH
jgi:hypothetical protein